MVLWIKNETACLAFASLGLLTTSMVSMACIGLMVQVNVLMANLIIATERKLPTDYASYVLQYSMYITAGLAVVLAVMAVSLVFLIILTKGLISKKAHLVKAYFIYGVTKNIFSVLTMFSLMTIPSFNIQSVFGIFGCILYSLILMMIRKTYLKFETPDYEQFDKKKLKDQSIA